MQLLVKMRAWLSLAAMLLFGSDVAAAQNAVPTHEAGCYVELVVLGVGQDAGIPQIGQKEDPAWTGSGDLKPGLARYATSLGLIDHGSGRRYLFEATPDLRPQLQRLDHAFPSKSRGLGIDGIFLTHAHIGHYAGLMFLGRESAGTRGIPVFAMPRMREFLIGNGPWSQLVSLGNIALRPLEDGDPVKLTDSLSVTPHRVPHRDEFSETVGFSIRGPTASALFIPDIDSWQRWEEEFQQRIETQIASHDVAYLDATFFDDNELPGLDMSTIPHPRIAAMMDRFDHLPVAERSKVRFIHINQSNPARYENSAASIAIRERGYRVAREGESVCLSQGALVPVLN